MWSSMKNYLIILVGTTSSLTYPVISVQEDDSAPSHTRAGPVGTDNPVEILSLNEDGRAET